MDVDTMQAGRELDALIAEKIMGFRRVVENSFDYDNKQYNNEILIPPAGNLKGYRLPNRGKIPFDFFVSDRYSTDMAAAWQVVEAMKARGLRLSLDAFGGDPWWCEFADETWTYGAQAEADTAPLAICRAALTAVQP